MHRLQACIRDGRSIKTVPRTGGKLGISEKVKMIQETRSCYRACSNYLRPTSNQLRDSAPGKPHQSAGIALHSPTSRRLVGITVTPAHTDKHLPVPDTSYYLATLRSGRQGKHLTKLARRRTVGNPHFSVYVKGNSCFGGEPAELDRTCKVRSLGVYRSLACKLHFASNRTAIWIVGPDRAPSLSVHVPLVSAL